MSSTLSKKKKQRIIIGILLVFAITLFIPTPYYIYRPGTVEELASKVTVEDGDKSAEGSLYLTTVLSMRASNIYYLAYGLLAPHTDLRKVKEVRGNMSDEEYSRLLEHMMNTSQQNAYAAAFQAANEEITITPKGVFVRQITETSDAFNKLEVGDVITQVDEQPVKEATDFIDYLAHKKAGDTIKLTFVRDSSEKTESIKLIPLENGANSAGVGIVAETKYTVDTARNVNIDAEDIGGPSAGLMFSLEIYNQLTPGDITKGYEIAGTGTIDMNGNVGQIGGIREKITAVDRADIDIFFCPADIGEYDTNEKEVLEKAKEEGYDVTIVPVKTLQEAIDYLQNLPEKK